MTRDLWMFFLPRFLLWCRALWPTQWMLIFTMMWLFVVCDNWLRTGTSNAQMNSERYDNQASSDRGRAVSGVVAHPNPHPHPHPSTPLSCTLLLEKSLRDPCGSAAFLSSGVCVLPARINRLARAKILVEAVLPRASWTRKGSLLPEKQKAGVKLLLPVF